MTSPRAASNPASNAALCPPFFAIRSTRSHGYCSHRLGQQLRRLVGAAVVDDDHLERPADLRQRRPHALSSVGTFSCSL